MKKIKEDLFQSEKSFLPNQQKELEVAKRMLKAGKSMEDIYDTTGYWLDEDDGLWKWEIDDTKGSFDFKKANDVYVNGGYAIRNSFSEIFGKIGFHGVPLREIINHPILDMFPNLGTMVVVKTDPNVDIGAAATQFKENFYETKSGEVAIVINPNEVDYSGVILHELQHVMQLFESRLPLTGEGNLDFLQRQYYPKYAYDYLMEHSPEFVELDRAIMNKHEETLDILAAYGEYNEKFARAEEQFATLKDTGMKYIYDFLVDLHLNIGTKPVELKRFLKQMNRDVYNIYWSHPSEVEARTISRRFSKRGKERPFETKKVEKNTPPDTSKLDELIPETIERVRFGGDVDQIVSLILERFDEH